MKRLFIAINLPEKIKNEIARVLDQIDLKHFPQEPNFRWIAQDNWHLTITFLDSQPDEKVKSISNAIQLTCAKFLAPEIVFDKIILGPPNRQPRMVWLVGHPKTSNTLGLIKDALEKNLINQGIQFKRETRKYNAHLTLARFQPFVFNKQIQNELETLNPVNITFAASTLDLMESQLNANGADYQNLYRVNFNK